MKHAFTGWKLCLIGFAGWLGSVALATAAEPLAVAPFDAAAARKYQEAAANSIGQPVEVTNSIGMKLVLIPPGEFEMGSDETADDLAAAGFEGEIITASPAHRVKITRPFYLGSREVTLNEFLKFYHAAGYKCECERDGEGGFGVDMKNAKLLVKSAEYRPWSWGYDGQTFHHPVVNVSWNDCVAFCEWLSKKEGVAYRLPTEAEWEYACRAGTTTRFSCGDRPRSLDGFANICDQALNQGTPFPLDAAAQKELGIARINDGSVFSAPVGRRRPNPFGLYDMHGNVYEWCRDWHDDYTADVQVDPQGPADGEARMYRGGGWFSTPASCRSAARGGSEPEFRTYSLGFRIVRDH